MSARAELIRLEGVEKRYGRQSVLRIDDLTIHDGDRIVLSGPNGSGKSTLLKVLGGIAPADRGRVWRAPELRREILGFVPQQGGLYGDLTVADNLRVLRGLNGMVPTDPRERPYVRELGLTPLLAKRFAELSGGYQRLATVAAALHVDPGWILLDEPLSGVDGRHVEVLLAELDRVDRVLRLLVVAAPTRVALPSANRFIEIDEGRIRCSVS
jgi:ABC-type multidrug transport system ATPase subunit